MGHLYRVTERKLGAGAYGHVYLAVSLVQQQQLACKIVNLRKLRLKEEQTEQERTKGIKRLCGIVPRKSVVDERVNKTFREVEILKDLDHVSIIDHGLPPANLTVAKHNSTGKGLQKRKHLVRMSICQK